MNTQRQAFNPGPATGNMSEREDLVRAMLIAAHPAGVLSIDLGREIHQRLAACLYCSDLRTCQFARGEGERVGKQLRDRDIAIKRKATNRWELLHPPVSGHDPKTADWPEGF